MNSRWLPYVIITFLAVVILLFFGSFVKPINVQPGNTTGSQTATVTEPTATFVNPARGAKNPRVVMIEFSDFACEHCADVQTAIQAALRAYPDDVRHVWKNLPNPSAHEQSIPAAVAAHCADRQGRFWDYHDSLFIRQDFLSNETYQQIASELKLDTVRFASCLENQDTYPLVEKDAEEAHALGLIATPTLFIGSQKVVGSISAEELVGLIAEALASP